MPKKTIQYLISGLFLSALCFAQTENGWVLTPPTTTYPVNPYTTATLKSSTEPTAALVLSSKTEHFDSPRRDYTSLTAYLDVGDSDLQIESPRWGKDCTNRPCTTAMISPAGIKVELVFDGGKPINDLWGSGDGSAIMPTGGNREFTKTQLLDKLKVSKNLIVSYTLHGGIHKSATFDVSSSSAAIDSVCPQGCEL